MFKRKNCFVLEKLSSLGQKMLMKPQDLEAMTSMMYNMSLQQGKTKETIQSPSLSEKSKRSETKLQ